RDVAHREPQRHARPVRVGLEPVPRDHAHDDPAAAAPVRHPGEPAEILLVQCVLMERGKKRGRAQRETSAGGVLFRRGPDGVPRFLLIRDSYRNWGFPKGHLKVGEPPADAARREVAEETGRAVKRGYPRGAGTVRLCRDLGAVERLLQQRLVDAVVLDVKAVSPAEAALALPGRFPRIPMFVLSAFRPDDGPLLAACHAAG